MGVLSFRGGPRDVRVGIDDRRRTLPGASKLRRAATSSPRPGRLEAKSFARRRRAHTQVQRMKLPSPKTSMHVMPSGQSASVQSSTQMF